jgi:HEPN domain-containing protein
MNVDNPTRARAWLTNAQSDMLAAVRLKDDVAHLACFHSQQAAEKALKAVLTLHEGDVPLTHVLRELIAACREAEVELEPTISARALSLEKYYIPTRYPDALGWADAASAYNTRDAEQAIGEAQAVVDWATRLLAGA